MPIFYPPQSVQDAVSGTNIKPTLGPSLDAVTTSARQEQLAARQMFVQTASQIPGFAEYAMANHGDLISDLIGPARVFGGAAKPPLSQRLTEAMHAFSTQPAPTETSLTGEQTANLRNKAIEFLGGPDAVRRMAVHSPQQVADALELFERGARAVDPKQGAAFMRQAAEMAQSPVPKIANDVADAYETIGPIAESLGLRSPAEKMRYAWYAATNKDTPEMLALRRARDEADLVGKRLENERKETDNAIARLALGQKAAGALLPDKITEELGDYNSAGRLAFDLLGRLDEIVKKNGVPPTGKFWWNDLEPALQRSFDADMAHFAALTDTLFAPLRTKIIGASGSEHEMEFTQNIMPLLGKTTSVQELRAAFLAIVRRATDIGGERLDAFGSIPDHNTGQFALYASKFDALRKQLEAEAAKMGGTSRPGGRFEVRLGGGRLTTTRPEAD